MSNLDRLLNNPIEIDEATLKLCVPGTMGYEMLQQGLLKIKQGSQMPERSSQEPKPSSHQEQKELGNEKSIILAAKIILEKAMETYTERKADKATQPADLIWVLYPAISAAVQILKLASPEATNNQPK